MERAGDGAASAPRPDLGAHSALLLQLVVLACGDGSILLREYVGTDFRALGGWAGTESAGTTHPVWLVHKG